MLRNANLYHVASLLVDALDHRACSSGLAVHEGVHTDTYARVSILRKRESLKGVGWVRLEIDCKPI